MRGNRTIRRRESHRISEKNDKTDIDRNDAEWTYPFPIFRWPSSAFQNIPFRFYWGKKQTNKQSTTTSFRLALPKQTMTGPYFFKLFYDFCFWPFKRWILDTSRKWSPWMRRAPQNPWNASRPPNWKLVVAPMCCDLIVCWSFCDFDAAYSRSVERRLESSNETPISSNDDSVFQK